MSAFAYANSRHKNSLCQNSDFFVIDNSCGFCIIIIFCQDSNYCIVWNRQVSPKAHSLNFASNCACATLHWVLLMTKKTLRYAGFFASLRFLTCLCYKKLKLSTHCVQLRRKNSKDRAGIAQVNWSLYQQAYLVLLSLCARWITLLQERARKLCSATLNLIRLISLVICTPDSHKISNL